MRILNMILCMISIFLVTGCSSEDIINKEEYNKTLESNISEMPEETANETKKEVQEPTSNASVEEKNIVWIKKKEPPKIIMFHNNMGPMCLEQLDFLDEMKSKYLSLVVEEHLTYETGTMDLLYEIKYQYGLSYGISTNYEFLPITFINNHSYSGFNRAVEERIEEDIIELIK